MRLFCPASSSWLEYTLERPLWASLEDISASRPLCVGSIDGLSAFDSEFPWLSFCRSAACFDKWKFLGSLSGSSPLGNPPSVLTSLPRHLPLWVKNYLQGGNTRRGYRGGSCPQWMHSLHSLLMVSLILLSNYPQLLPPASSSLALTLIQKNARGQAQIPLCSFLLRICRMAIYCQLSSRTVQILSPPKEKIMWAVCVGKALRAVC